MNWMGLVRSLIVIVVILAVYLILMNTKLKNKFDEYPFLPLGIILVVLVVVGVIARVALL